MIEAPQLLAHGGTAGILLEGGLPLVVLIVFAAVWIRERRARRLEGETNDGAARRPLFRDEDEESPRD